MASAAVVPAARYSACEIERHPDGKKTSAVMVSVCEVVLVTAIGPVFPSWCFRLGYTAAMALEGPLHTLNRYSFWCGDGA